MLARALASPATPRNTSDRTLGPLGRPRGGEQNRPASANSSQTGAPCKFVTSTQTHPLCILAITVPTNLLVISGGSDYDGKLRMTRDAKDLCRGHFLLSCHRCEIEPSRPLHPGQDGKTTA